MLPLAAFAIPGAIQGGLGLLQLLKGGSMNPVRPSYEIPKAAQEELTLSRMGLNGRMPGAAQAEERIDQNAAGSGYRLQKGATNSSQLLSGLSGIQLNSNIAARGLMESEAVDRARREAIFRRSLGVMAGFQDKKWQLDKYEPFQDAARTKAALVGGGLQNLAGGVNQSLSGLLAGQMMQNGGTPAPAATNTVPQWLQMFLGQNNRMGQSQQLFDTAAGIF